MQQDGLLTAAAIKEENAVLREKQRIADEAAQAAGLGQDAAERDAERQRQLNKQLLEKLLREQRKSFEDEIETLKKRIAGRT